MHIAPVLSCQQVPRGFKIVCYKIWTEYSKQEMTEVVYGQALHRLVKGIEQSFPEPRFQTKFPLEQYVGQVHPAGLLGHNRVRRRLRRQGPARAITARR